MFKKIMALKIAKIFNLRMFFIVYCKKCNKPFYFHLAETKTYDDDFFKNMKFYKENNYKISLVSKNKLKKIGVCDCEK
jgi:hypothetical protein